MSVSWKDVGGAVARFAPVVGTILGGPAGAVVGAAGALVASALGVPPTPDEVQKAMTVDPQAAVKIKELEVTRQVELQKLLTSQVIADRQADTEDQKNVNETMRVEANSAHWPQWAWRPFIGFTFGLAFLAVCAFVCRLAYDAIWGGHPEAIAMIPQLVSAFTMLFAIPGGILGVSAWHRGQQKREALGGS